MTAPIPTREPERLSAGDTWQWTRTFGDYPASTWTLNYFLAVEGAGANPITFEATADGDTFAITVAAATTAAYAAGSYQWTAYATDGSERRRVDEGRLEILANVATADDTYDPRSHAQKILDALEALILGRTTKDVNQYAIGGRQLTKMAPEELRTWRSFYQTEVRKEKQQDKLAKGMGTSAVTRFRF